MGAIWRWPNSEPLPYDIVLGWGCVPVDKCLDIASERLEAMLADEAWCKGEYKDFEVGARVGRGGRNFSVKDGHVPAV